jgi:hypothetical protein
MRLIGKTARAGDIGQRPMCPNDPQPRVTYFQFMSELPRSDTVDAREAARHGFWDEPMRPRPALDAVGVSLTEMSGEEIRPVANRSGYRLRSGDFRLREVTGFLKVTLGGAHNEIEIA